MSASRITFDEETIRTWLSSWVPARFLDEAMRELRERAGLDASKPIHRKPTPEQLERARKYLRRAGVDTE